MRSLRTPMLFVLLPAVLAILYAWSRTGSGADMVKVSVPGSPQIGPPTVTLQPGQAVIESFQVDRTEVDPGGTVNLSWVSRGTTKTSIVVQGMFHRFPAPGIPVAASGTLAYRVPEHTFHGLYFGLTAEAVPGREVRSATRLVSVRCVTTWWAESPLYPNCPSAARAVTVTEQPFEHGFLLQVPDLPGHVGFVLFWWRDSRGTAFPAWRPGSGQDAASASRPRATGESGAAETPPAGLFAPGARVAPMWWDYRSTLGWATGPEVTFVTIGQTDSSEYPTYYFRSADGGLWVIGRQGSYWEHRRPER